jgi:hypothetical protein
MQRLLERYSGDTQPDLLARAFAALEEKTAA